MQSIKRNLGMFYEIAITYPAPITLNYNYNFGIYALIVLGFQIVTGIFLVMFYCSNLTLAFLSIEHITILILPFIARPLFCSSIFKLNILFVANCIVLSYIGKSPLEEHFLSLGKISTIFFFVYFILIKLAGFLDKFMLPYLKRKEKYVLGLVPSFFFVEDLSIPIELFYFLILIGFLYLLVKKPLSFSFKAIFLFMYVFILLEKNVLYCDSIEVNSIENSQFLKFIPTIYIILTMSLFIYILIYFLLFPIKFKIYVKIFLPLYFTCFIITYLPIFGFLLMLVSTVGLIFLDIDIPLKKLENLNQKKKKLSLQFLTLLKKYHIMELASEIFMIFYCVSSLRFKVYFLIIVFFNIIYILLSCYYLLINNFYYNVTFFENHFVLFHSLLYIGLLAIYFRFLAIISANLVQKALVIDIELLSPSLQYCIVPGSSSPNSGSTGRV